jgi:hypothetical protein
MFIGNLLRYNVHSTIIEEGLWEMREGEVPPMSLYFRYVAVHNINKVT